MPWPISSGGNLTFHIYKITSPSGGCYIGISKNIELRQRNYKNSECVNQPLLFNSLKKYGWENHSFEILDSFTSNDDFALGREMFWIRSYMSCRNVYPDQHGLNATIGGRGNFRNKMSIETRAKISHKNKGKRRTEEQRNHLSKVRKGFNTYWPSDETKKKMSNARMGFKQSDEVKKKLSAWRMGKANPKESFYTEKRKESYKRLYKPVIQFDLNGNFIREYESVDAAAIGSGMSEGSVKGSAKGYIKNPTKFIFKYKRDAVTA